MLNLIMFAPYISWRLGSGSTYAIFVNIYYDFLTPYSVLIKPG
jgi:hypothetical protein